ncbi:hypothetical protein FKP32DRAFT_228181 [Trametes sanguinea]|nr:hypothetical protein FKP32DRAFT_228181 [Trametes sanguinea]
MPPCRASGPGIHDTLPLSRHLTDTASVERCVLPRLEQGFAQRFFNRRYHRTECRLQHWCEPDLQLCQDECERLHSCASFPWKRFENVPFITFIMTLSLRN